jgi:hypothetical protein
MNFDYLNDDNYVLFAAKHYNNPQCYSLDEFNEDLKRIKYLKKLFSRYEKSGELKERLILNHIIIIYNVFGVEASTKLLFYKLYKYKQYLKPFLVLLKCMPEVVYGINKEETIRSSDIPMDILIVEKLRNI